MTIHTTLIAVFILTDPVLIYSNSEIPAGKCAWIGASSWNNGQQYRWIELPPNYNNRTAMVNCWRTLSAIFWVQFFYHFLGLHVWLETILTITRLLLKFCASDDVPPSDQTAFVCLYANGTWAVRGPGWGEGFICEWTGMDIWSTFSEIAPNGILSVLDLSHEHVVVGLSDFDIYPRSLIICVRITKYSHSNTKFYFLNFCLNIE